MLSAISIAPPSTATFPSKLLSPIPGPPSMAYESNAFFQTLAFVFYWCHLGGLACRHIRLLACLLLNVREIEKGNGKRLSRKFDLQWKKSIVVRPHPSLKKLQEEEAAEKVHLHNPCTSLPLKIRNVEFCWFKLFINFCFR
ncbi:unnamed protein product [Malus baccata var. baccata]